MQLLVPVGDGGFGIIAHAGSPHLVDDAARGGKADGPIWIVGRYDEVLAEFPVVVKAGGAWTSVTPGSQQYWLQAFNNVLYGRWKKIDAGYGKAVLGYFGRPPLPPDPEVVRVASQQLDMPPFEGDPLEAAPDSLGPARAALEERGLPATEENVFLVAAAIVGGKSMDLNEGIRFLTGKAKIVLPLKKKPEPPAATVSPAPAGSAGATAAITAPVTTTCSAPSPNTSRRISHRREGFSSMPMMNNSRTTPSSARWRISSALSIRPSTDGPTRIPASRKPGTVPSPITRARGTATTAAASRMMMSVR